MSAVLQETDEIQLCSFTVGERLFGVPIDEVREITSVDQIMPVPHAAETVAGFVNIRGHIHLVLSLRKMMGYDGDDDHHAEGSVQRMVVFKPSCGPAFGILIDEVRDILTIKSDALVDRRSTDQAPPEGVERRAARASLVRGVCPLDNELILVLKGSSLLEEFGNLD